MSLFSKFAIMMNLLSGVKTAPVQLVRRSDGVRGLSTRKNILPGSKIMSIPLRYCCFPNGLSGSTSSGGSTDRSVTEHWNTPQRIRNANRRWSLFPEGVSWLARYSRDADSPVQLSGSASAAGGDKVYSISITPVEAAAATCIALRYFFQSVAKLTSETRTHIGPPPNPAADQYVQLLPISRHLALGVESLRAQQFDSDGEVHLCLEVIAMNLREAVLEQATNSEYDLYDRFASVFDDLILVCLYIVRARVFQLPLLHPNDPERDVPLPVMAPYVELMNYGKGTESNVTGAISLRSDAVVVLAKRPIQRGEELLIDYGGKGVDVEESQHPNWFSNRYLFQPE